MKTSYKKRRDEWCELVGKDRFLKLPPEQQNFLIKTAGCIDIPWHPETFWTPAERAGLKAMGEVYKDWEGCGGDEMEGVWFAIHAFVRAARASKEGK